MEPKSDLVNRAQNALESYDLRFFSHEVWRREHIESVATLDGKRLEQLGQLIIETDAATIDFYRRSSRDFPNGNEPGVQGVEESRGNWMKAIEKGFQLVNDEIRRRADELAHELAVKQAEFAHLERIKGLELEIERAKLETARAQSSAEYSDKAAEREHIFRLEELKAKFEAEMVRLSQPHDLKKQEGELFKELVRYQSDLAEKADKTDFEKEMDVIMSAIVKTFEPAGRMPKINDPYGNLDDVASDARYRMALELNLELIKARVASAKKDLAG